MDEGGDPPLELRPGEQDAPRAALAAQADVGAKSDDLPLVAPTGVRFAQLYDVSKVQLDNWPGSSLRL